MSRTIKQPDHHGRNGEPYPLLPMGQIEQSDDQTIGDWYDYALKKFVEGSLISSWRWPAGSQKLDTIRKLQATALDAYIHEAQPHLRTSDRPERIILSDGGPLTRAKVYSRLEEKNHHPFKSLMARVCDLRQVSNALDTGTDRTASSKIEDDFQSSAMERFGLAGHPEEVTFAKDWSNTHDAVTVNPREAILIYASESLQTIAPDPEDLDPYSGSYDFMAFIDPGLRKLGLLAIIQA